LKYPTWPQCGSYEKSPTMNASFKVGDRVRFLTNDGGPGLDEALSSPGQWLEGEVVEVLDDKLKVQCSEGPYLVAISACKHAAEDDTKPFHPSPA
jgi:hypothetical protein